MSKILVVTKDSSWRTHLLKNAGTNREGFVFTTDLRSKTAQLMISQCSLIVLDFDLLPPPESPTINRIREMVQGTDILTVYDPGTQIGMLEYRIANSLGAVGILKKPYAENEIGSLFMQSERAQVRSEKRLLWHPPIPQW